MPTHIHVVQGDTAAGSFIQAMSPKPGELLAHRDVLSLGPLPPLRSLEQWSRVRQEFWDAIAEGDPPGLIEYESGILVSEASLRDADSILLWLGVGVAEQLLLAWLIQLLTLSQSRAEVRVAQFTDAWGVGLLKPERIKSHPPIEVLSSEVVAELERYWAALTSPDPGGLLSVVSAGDVHLPHFRSALQTLLRRYPDHQTGLGRWDAELLKYVRERGPRVVRVLGWTMGDNFDADLVGDGYLFSRLLQLGSPGRAHPLVSISGDPTNMRTCEVSLTAAGHAVLDGRANAIELNGIDDWVLGVHLSSERGTVWYQKDGTLVSCASGR
jgi:hypothetical protein